MVFGPNCEARCVACKVEESLQRVVFNNATHEVPVDNKISWGVLSKIRRGILPPTWTG